MPKQLATFLLLVLFSITSYAGKIKGVVKDAADNSTLSGVLINIKNTTTTTVTDENGNYVFDNVADGKYEVIFSFVTYKKVTEKVTVSGEETVVDVKLEAENSKVLKNVNVAGTRVTRTENAVMMELKKSNVIASGISAAQIGKTMDRNAADVVKRVPGVTIVDDRFIVVRGLADRFNNVWLNDAGVPSSETDKKSFSFDLIPSGLIDRILIYKTPSPELPGDFAGGMVKVYTTSMPEKNQIELSLQSSYRQNSTGTMGYFEPSSKTDKFGYDDGKRSLPAIVPANDILKKDPNINAISKSFGNDWLINQKKLMPDARFSLSASGVLKLGGVKIGNTLGLSYTNTSTNYKIDRQDWTGKDEVYHDSDLRSTNKVNAGLLNNTVVTFGNSKIEFKNLYNQEGKAYVTYRTNAPDTFAARLNDPDEKSYQIGYESRAIYTSQLSGTHKGKNDRWKYNWTLGYSDLFKNTPDLRRIKYTKQKLEDDSMYKAQIANGVDIVNAGGRFYSQLFEHTYSAGHQFTYTAKIKNYSFDINAGNYIEYKSRYFKARAMSYTISSISNPNVNILPFKPLNEIFADSNIGANKKFLVEEYIDKANKYTAQNMLISGFLSAKLPIGEKVTIVTGVRYEDNKQSLQSFKVLDSVGLDLKTRFWLPSINASYNITDKSLVRVAYGKTLNRPEFREQAPFHFYDFDERADIYGAVYSGDTLKVTQINNIDARFEWYPSTGEMVQIGGFYKTFKDPIQRIIIGIQADGRQVGYTNVTKAYSAGVELDVRKSLAFADEMFKTNIFKDFMLVGNATYIKSELTIDSIPGRLTQLKHTPLQGQSPYMFNAGLFYQSESLNLQSSLLFNVYGPRLTTLGVDFPGGESIGEMPFRSLDFTLAKTFYKHYVVNFGVQNLLDSKVQFMVDRNRDSKFNMKDDGLYSGYKPGRYFSMGVKVKF